MLYVQLYVTKETSANYATGQTTPEDGLEKIANFMKSTNRFHRKCTSVLQKHMMLSSDIKRTYRQYIRKYNSISNVRKME